MLCDRMPPIFQETPAARRDTGTQPAGHARLSPVPPSPWGHPATVAEAVTAIQLLLQVHLVLPAAREGLRGGSGQSVPAVLGHRRWGHSGQDSAWHVGCHRGRTKR